MLDGKKIAQLKEAALKKTIKKVLGTQKRRPLLVIFLLGNHPASEIYVLKKQSTASRIGIETQVNKLSENISTDSLIFEIQKANQDSKVDGIIVQLPLPQTINTPKILESITPSKDVDGFHPYNQGKLLQCDPTFHPATPKGIMHLLREIPVSLRGLKAVILGTSYIVGRPMALELLWADATVTLCHSQTKDIEKEIAQADLLVVAVGKPNWIIGEWIKPGAIVIDAGINRLEHGKIVGDVDFDSVKEKASWLTPVPGGVGPMTVIMLLENTLEAYLSKQTSLQN